VTVLLATLAPLQSVLLAGVVSLAFLSCAFRTSLPDTCIDLNQDSVREDVVVAQGSWENKQPQRARARSAL
jgi:hypothetical protein